MLELSKIKRGESSIQIKNNEGPKWELWSFGTQKRPKNVEMNGMRFLRSEFY